MREEEEEEEERERPWCSTLPSLPSQGAPAPSPLNLCPNRHLNANVSFVSNAQPGSVSAAISPRLMKHVASCSSVVHLLSSRSTTHQARSQSWKSYVSHITCDTPIAAIWSRIRRISGKHVPPPSPVLALDRRSVADASQVVDALGQHLSHASTGSRLSPTFHRIKSVSESVPISFILPSTGVINAAFSPRELSSALQSCRDTSDGLDGIHYSMLKHLSLCAFSSLLAFYNQLWVTGFFPAEWRKAVILPFLKSGKSGSHSQDYRPIVLTSCLCKLFEKMADRRLMWHLESHSLLPPLSPVTLFFFTATGATQGHNKKGKKKPLTAAPQSVRQSKSGHNQNQFREERCLDTSLLKVFKL